MINLWKSIKMFLCMLLLTGLFYPLAITGLANLSLKSKARGSLITFNERIVGSLLIAQKFESDLYFWPRPSAHNYDGLASGGSNLGPTSALLKKIVSDRKSFLLKTHALPEDTPVPAELLFASGSGLDPHISPATAYFQLHRILKARNNSSIFNEKTLSQLIEKNTQKPFLFFIGPPFINVLKLNIALDELQNHVF